MVFPPGSRGRTPELEHHGDQFKRSCLFSSGNLFDNCLRMSRAPCLCTLSHSSLWTTEVWQAVCNTCSKTCQCAPGSVSTGHTCQKNACLRKFGPLLDSMPLSSGLLIDRVFRVKVQSGLQARHNILQMPGTHPPSGPVLITQGWKCYSLLRKGSERKTMLYHCFPRSLGTLFC